MKRGRGGNMGIGMTKASICNPQSKLGPFAAATPFGVSRSGRSGIGMSNREGRVKNRTHFSTKESKHEITCRNTRNWHHSLGLAAGLLRRPDLLHEFLHHWELHLDRRASRYKYGVGLHLGRRRQLGGQRPWRLLREHGEPNRPLLDWCRHPLVEYCRPWCVVA